MTAAIAVLSTLTGLLIIAVFVLWGRLERLATETRQATEAWARALDDRGPGPGMPPLGLTKPPGAIRVPDADPGQRP